MPERNEPFPPARTTEVPRLNWLARAPWKSRSSEESLEILRREPRVHILLRREERMIVKLYCERPLLYWRNVFRSSPAEREFRGLEALEKVGVRAPRPGWWGEQRQFGIYTSSFLTMSFLPEAIPLKAFLGRASMPRAERLDVIETLARQVARMHSAGVWHGRLTPKNVLVHADPENGKPLLYLIDTVLCLQFEKGLPEMARRLDLLHLLGRDLLSRTDKLRFLRAYDPPEELASYWSAIQRSRGFLRKLWEELTYPTLAMHCWWERRRAANRERARHEGDRP